MPHRWVLLVNYCKKKKKKKKERRKVDGTTVLKPGPARRVDPGPGRPGPGIDPGLSKNPHGSWSGEIRSTRWVDPEPDRPR
jgi:hypothetical protein